MEKRLPFALLLSFLVFMWWSTTLPPRPVDETGSSTTASNAAEGGASPLEGYVTPSADQTSKQEAAQAEELIHFAMGAPGTEGSYRLTFSNKGARLLELDMGDYFTERDVSGFNSGDETVWVPLLSSVKTPDGMTGSLSLAGGVAAKAWLVEPLETALWQHRILDNDQGIEFTYAPGTGLVFRKRLERAPGSYQLRFSFEVENLSAEGASGLKQFLFTPAEAVRPTEENSRFYQEPQALALWSGVNGEREIEAVPMRTGGQDLVGPMLAPADYKMDFAGVHNKFFAFLVSPPTRKEANVVVGANYRRLKDEGWAERNPEEDDGDAWNLVICDLSLQVNFPEVGKKSELVFDLFAGPKQRQILEGAKESFGELLDEDIGMFSGVANIITAILSFYHGLVGNWGWAIILMTLTVRALLFRLNRKAQTSMARFAKKMKRVQPMLDANKEKFKDDVKRQREEQAKIMQKEGAFPPLGGCAPMLLQFPIFIGLFQALRVHFDLRHEPFILWMKDLSQPDHMARIDFEGWVPLIGDFTIPYFNILPLIMIVLWIGQHKVMPQPESTDPKQAQTRKIMIVMQVFFAFLFYNYASGLALYMITSSSVAIFESLVIKRLWPIDDTEQEPKKRGKFMTKMADLQKAQQAKLEQEAQMRAKHQKNKGKKKR